MIRKKCDVHRMCMTHPRLIVSTDLSVNLLISSLFTDFVKSLLIFLNGAK